MADTVLIDIPGVGNIEAKNAATESTLRELVNAIKGLQKNVKDSAAKNTSSKGNAAKQGPDYKDLNNANKGAGKAAVEGAKGMNMAGAAGRVLGGAMRKMGNVASTAGTAFGTAARGADALTARMGAMTTSITDTLEELGNLGDSVSSAARTMRHIPIVGGTLANVFGAVAAAAQNVTGAFQSSASVGATFNGSVQDMSRAASGAGLTMDNFGKLLQQNGQNLMLLGGTTEAGAKRFATLSKNLIQGDLGGQLLRMGYSTQEVNDGMLKYAGIMGRTGALSRMSNDQLVKGSSDYLKEMDALAKVTGASRQAKQQEMDALMSDAKVRAALATIEDPEQQRKMMAYVLSFPKEAQKAMADMVSTGNITTEESIKLNTMLPGAAAQAMQFGRTLRAGGKMTDAAINQAKNDAILESRVSVKRNQALGLYSDQFGQAYVAAAEIGAQSVDGYNKALSEQAGALEKKNLAEELGKAQQQIAQVSNEFQLFLAQSGMLSTFLDAFKAIASFASTVLMPAFSLIGGAINAVVPIMTDLLIPAFQILGDWISTAVVPIFQTMGNIISSYLMPTFSSVGSVLEDYLEPALYLISDFIEDNLEPIMVSLGVIIGTMVIGKLFALGAALFAQIAATWAVVAPFLALAGAVIAATWPLLAIGAAIYAVVKIVKNWTDVLSIGKEIMSMTFSTIKTGVMMLFKGLLSLINKIPGFRGDFDDAIKGLDDKLSAEQQSRDKSAEKIGQAVDNMMGKTSESQKKTDDRKASRDEKRQEREAQRQARLQGRESQLLKNKEDLQKKEEAKNEQPSVNMSDPLVMLKSFAARNNSAYTKESDAEAGKKQSSGQSLAVIDSNLKNLGEGVGRVAAKFESGSDAGRISSGIGDRGGKSYGAFQLASNTGDVDKFLKSTGYDKVFQGMKVGSDAFDAKWKDLAKNDEQFTKSQQAYAKQKYYDPQSKKLQGAGMDLSGKGEAVQEAILSTANQYGANTELIIKALKGKDTDKMSDKDIVNAIQDYKAENVKSNFRSSSAAVQQGVGKRIEQERSMLLGIDAGGQGDTVKYAGGAASAEARPARGKGATAAQADMPSVGQAFQGLINDGINPTTLAFKHLSVEMPKTLKSMHDGIRISRLNAAEAKQRKPVQEGPGTLDKIRSALGMSSKELKGQVPVEKSLAKNEQIVKTASKAVADAIPKYDPSDMARQNDPLYQKLVKENTMGNSAMDKQLAIKAADMKYRKAYEANQGKGSKTQLSQDIDVQNTAREKAELKNQSIGTPQQDKIKEQMARSMAAKDSAERAAKRHESDAKFATNAGAKQHHLTSAENAKGEAALQEAKIKKLREELGANKPTQAAGDLSKVKSTQTPTGAQAAQAMAEEKKKEEIKKVQTEAKPAVSKEIKPTQESAEALLAQLNTKLDELITINRKVAEINDSQLRVQKNMGNDLYA